MPEDPRPKGPDPEQLQNSMDMLALALGQTSRDPGLLAQVQMQIESRRTALAAQQLGQLKVAGDLQKTAMQEQGATERTAMQQGGAFERTQLEQAGALQRTQLQERGAAARTKFTADAQAQRTQTSSSLDAAKLAQDAVGDAQTLFRGLLGGGEAASAMTAILGAQVAPLLQKKELSKEEQAQVAFYQSLKEGGKMDPAQALDFTAKFLASRVAGMPPEAAAMAQAAFDTFTTGFGLIPKAVVGGVSKEEVAAATTAITQRMFDTPSGEGQVQLQLAISRIVEQYGDDPEAQEQMVMGVMAAVGSKIEADGPEELARHMAQVEAILEDGVQAEDAGTLGQVMRDMGVKGFEEEGPGIRERMRTIFESIPGTREQRAREATRDSIKAAKRARKAAEPPRSRQPASIREDLR